MRYFLVGIPCAGKSTLGERAAEILKLPFYDTDVVCVEKMNLQQESYNVFSYARRAMEIQKTVFYDIVSRDENAIVSVGAVMPVDCGLIYELPKFGTVIHVKRSVELAYASAVSEAGMVMIEVDSNGVPETKVKMRGESVKEYSTDLPTLERHSHFAIENDGCVESGVEKLVELITQIMDQSSEKKHESKFIF